MTKELQEFEKSIKKERSHVLKERRQEIFAQCVEVYDSITIIEMRLIWYLRQFTQYDAEYYMNIARGVYRNKLAVARSVQEEKKSGVDKA